MTLEFWPRRLLTSAPRRRPRKTAPRSANRAPRPKLPIRAGQAHQKLSQAIICRDDELASWLDRAVKQGQISGDPDLIQQLKERLDSVMAPPPA